ncbi:MAG: hypothetical protein IJT02_07655 [Synergistaceae bacterium]|nr:hypothetical protein [Synergistaceae bacterium]
MKKVIVLFALLVVIAAGACSASADTPAREGMIAYSGTEAFTKLTPEERQACTSWLVYGGEMNDDCKKATMKLIAEAPEAVTAEQRKALTAAASGNTVAAKTPEAPKQEEPPVIKKDDTGAKIAAIGLIAIMGLVIHNNMKRHHRSEPVYQPEPPRSAPGRERVPAPRNDRRPPQPPRVPTNQQQRPPRR